MNSQALLDVAKILFYFGVPAACAIAYVLCLLVCGSRHKAIRLMGLAFSLSCITAILSRISSILAYLNGKGIVSSEIYMNGSYTTLLVIVGLISLVIGIVARYLIWLYAHREYGVETLWCVVTVVLPVVLSLASVLMNRLLYRTIGSQGNYAVSVMAKAIPLLATLAVDLIYVLLFYKHREEEKIIPKYWIFPLISMIGVLISYASEIGLTNNMDNYAYCVFFLLLSFLAGLIFPASCVYLFIQSRKPEPDKLTSPEA